MGSSLSSRLLLGLAPEDRRALSGMVGRSAPGVRRLTPPRAVGACPHRMTREVAAVYTWGLALGGITTEPWPPRGIGLIGLALMFLLIAAVAWGVRLGLSAACVPSD